MWDYRDMTESRMSFMDGHYSQWAFDFSLCRTAVGLVYCVGFELRVTPKINHLYFIPDVARFVSSKKEPNWCGIQIRIKTQIKKGKWDSNPLIPPHPPHTHAHTLLLSLPGCLLTLVQHFLCFYSQHFLSLSSSTDQQEDLWVYVWVGGWCPEMHLHRFSEYFTPITCHLERSDQ